MRRINRLSLEELAPYLLELPEVSRVLAWPELFENENPVEVEVGSGKGAFLLATALANPGINFIGVEIVRKYQLYTATRIAKRGLRNVRLARADARAFLRDFVRDDSIDTVHVYFPDPWWKRRHEKRRVFTSEFARECERVLRPGGRLSLATDVEEYFGVMTSLLSEETRLRALPPPTTNDIDPMTNFERKARAKGTPVYRCIWRKE